MGQILSGEWTDPERGKIKVGDYAAEWIEQRQNLQPRTRDLYTWPLRKHIAPHLGAVTLGQLSTPMVRGLAVGAG